jgi:phosphatidylethanolamine/phosphatidyl-N-methylethanolamine N-methyltransferase
METRRRPKLDEDAVRAAYQGWAPVYDYSFGVVSRPGRRLAVEYLNRKEGDVLEIGVGTGLSLPLYRRDLRVTGIDLSEDMLLKASRRIREKKLDNQAVAVMDAGRLAFAGESFDAVAAMYVMTVVPDPAKVMDEIWRVLKPGGEAIIVNHFSRDTGLRSAVENRLARFSRKLGWHPIFPLDNVLGRPGFKLLEKIELPPLGIFTLLRLQKISGGEGARTA